jgi:hypothetical protein
MGSVPPEASGRMPVAVWPLMAMRAGSMGGETMRGRKGRFRLLSAEVVQVVGMISEGVVKAPLKALNLARYLRGASQVTQSL